MINHYLAFALLVQKKGTFLMVQQVKNPPAKQDTQEMRDWPLGWEDALEKEMATLSSIFPEKSHRQRNLSYSSWSCKVQRIAKSQT